MLRSHISLKLTVPCPGLRVTGYEVNRLWWEGQHSTPHFINIGQWSPVTDGVQRWCWCCCRVRGRGGGEDLRDPRPVRPHVLLLQQQSVFPQVSGPVSRSVLLSSALLIITSHVRRHLCDSDWPHRWRPTLRPRAGLPAGEKMEISRSGGARPPSTCWGVQGAVIIQCPVKNRGQKLLKFEEARYFQLC